MSEMPIIISHINDFIFCPVSIYFHSLEMDVEDILLKDSYQLNGTNAHEKSDLATYSTKKSVLQGISVYSYRYDVCGKIDVFDCDIGLLTERKKRIKEVYDGYVFQLYAQYFALIDMGYSVNKIRLYSMEDNKIYNISLPEKNNEMMNKFQKLLADMKVFNFNKFKQNNKSKCVKCIYEPLCSFSALKGSDLI